jgi:hypothetical protein
MALRLASGRLIGISLGVKHEAYEHEKEVRLIIIASQEARKGNLRTRIRGSEIVPFMESGETPIKIRDGIVEIVVGPAAAPSAIDGVKRLLESFDMEPGDRVRSSGIPYRPV